jgi:excisionase family DNA binding protein
MSEPHNPSVLLGEALLQTMREALRLEIQALQIAYNTPALLTPEELADKLKVPLSWVYEQSRQGKIPTHRLGRYVRFNLLEVLASKKIT